MYSFQVMPWRSGLTPVSMLACDGSVYTYGWSTVWAHRVYEPDWMSRRRLGVETSASRSGRRPSMVIMTTCRAKGASGGRTKGRVAGDAAGPGARAVLGAPMGAPVV